MQPAKKRARGQYVEKVADGTPRRMNQGAAKGRAYIGMLAGLMHMPLDIFFEISSHLHPLDLLHLARVSKQLRSVMLSPKSRFIWITSLASVEGLPSCPEDMSEPAYSALLFCRICNLCNTSRSCWVDYAIRARLCKACYKKSVLKGQDILVNIRPAMRKLFMAMAPCETGKDIAVAVSLEQPSSHKLKNRYYLPQLLEMGTLALEHRKQLNGKPFTLDDVHFLTSDSVKFHKHATALLKWESYVASRKQEDGDALTASRKASIFKKLEDLGYVEDDFPLTNPREWTKIVCQPKALTDRIWHNIRPKLEALIQEEKESRAQEVIEARVEERLDQISAYYEEFVEGLPEADRALLPNLVDVHGLPSIDALARENEAQGDVAQEDFLVLTVQVLRETEAYAAEAKAIAVKALSQCFSRRGAHSYLEDLHKITPAEAMTRHYALFTCDKIRLHSASTMSPQLEYLTFEALHAHWRVEHPLVEWGARDFEGPGSWGHLRTAGEFHLGTGMDGKLILDAAGLPHDTPINVLTELVRAGRLYCDCGDPALPPPEQLDWPIFLAHVVEDLAQFREREAAGNKSAAPNPKLVLNSNHPLSGPAACITLLPEGADTAPARARASVVDPKTRKKVEERLALRPEPDWIPICRVCKALTAGRHLRHTREGLELPETPEGIVHHLRGWHGKTFEKIDILFQKAGW